VDLFLIKNKSFSITAEVEVKENAEGMIFTQGGLFGGLGLYLQKGKPVYHYNFIDVAHYEVAGEDRALGVRISRGCHRRRHPRFLAAPDH